MKPHIPLLLVGAALAACGDPNALPNARIDNIVDTVTIFALSNTPVTTPSGYSVNSGLVRLDQNASFDFAFDLDAQDRPLFMSLGALGLAQGNTVQPGWQKSDETFDAITRALSNGYNTEDTLVVELGGVYLIRSALICRNLGVPLYSKVEFLSQDLTERTLTFRVLANTNCGYRDLTPGIPKN